MQEKCRGNAGIACSVLKKGIRVGYQSVQSRMLRDCPHPGLPELYQVGVSDDATTVIEVYIEGQTSGAAQLTEKQFRQVVRELCDVLEFLHGKGIIHRDIKPSNILLEEGGHVRLIDFGAARMSREGAEQDTRLLGTKGFALWRLCFPFCLPGCLLPTATAITRTRPETR